MASRPSTQIFLVIIAIVAVFVPSVLAKEFVVGGDKGWDIKFDYQAWAQGKVFQVGDTLVFKYPQGAHNVYKVNGTAFQQCLVPHVSEALTSGNDVITLAELGKKWYICGVAKHCEMGNQKLAITVLPLLGSPESSPSESVVPRPTPPVSAARGSVATIYNGWMVAIFATLMMVMV